MTLFEWDEAKAESNRRKHGIDFDDAIEVFYDARALVEQDSVVDGEQRWRTLGMVGAVDLLLVAHTVDERDQDEVIRIISARRAVRRERKRYGENYSKSVR